MDKTYYEYNPVDYATYRYEVTHDNGKFTMSVLARSEAHGRQRIIDNELCPDCAIKTLLSSPIKQIKFHF